MAEQLQTDSGRLIYLATAVTTDEEMQQRVKKHQQDRCAKQKQWETLEWSMQLEEAAKHLTTDDVVFLDCVTTWLSNEMFQESGEMPSEKALKSKMICAVHALEAAAKHVVIVSNDIFHEPVSFHPQLFRYVKVLGELHQYIVLKADTAVRMECGNHVVMKGGILN